MTSYTRLLIEAEQAVRERLGGRRMEHVLGCAHTASALASIYGVDPEHAMLAGLLHDWDKSLGESELIERARQLRPDLDYSDESTLPVVHAFTGAAAVRERFPELPEEVLTAIARHTVGDTVMSPLDCIVYVADMIEPTRSFEGADTLRELVGTLSLEQLYFEAYRCTVRYLLDKGLPLYRDTATIYNSALKGLAR